MRKLSILHQSFFFGAARRLQNISLNSKYIILLVLTLVTIVSTFSIGRVPQSLIYHQFTDQRHFYGVPNFLNVFTNLPFIVIGVLGIINLQKLSVTGIHFWNYLLLFIAIFLTGFGSAFYHFSPENATLIFDRIPMTIIFMSFLSLTIAECINEKVARILLLPLIFFGISSVLFWYYSEIQGMGDLRMYGFVQFYSIYIIPVIAFLFPSSLFKKGINSLLWINVTYALAKFCEYFDTEIYSLVHLVSGHSLKHIAASLSGWFILKMFENKFSK
jgi:hypothetical protein